MCLVMEQLLRQFAEKAIDLGSLGAPPNTGAETTPPPQPGPVITPDLLALASLMSHGTAGSSESPEPASRPDIDFEKVYGPPRETPEPTEPPAPTEPPRIPRLTLGAKELVISTPPPQTTAIKGLKGALDKMRRAKIHELRRDDEFYGHLGIVALRAVDPESVPEGTDSTPMTPRTRRQRKHKFAVAEIAPTLKKSHETLDNINRTYEHMKPPRYAHVTKKEVRAQKSDLALQVMDREISLRAYREKASHLHASGPYHGVIRDVRPDEVIRPARSKHAIKTAERVAKLKQGVRKSTVKQQDKIRRKAHRLERKLRQ